MNEQVKQKWIEALQSGDYKQAKGCLNDGKGMCCLGVLTDLYVKEHDDGWHSADGIEYALASEMDQVMILPTKVYDWSDVDGPSPNLPFQSRDAAPHNTTGFTGLAVINDSGLPFTQIADLIKAFL